jgi:hypothetical protein
MFPLPGHTLFASAIAFEADGRRIVATGDQQDGGWVGGEQREILNFHYRNRFRFDDFVDSAHLYRRLRPELMISGHWLPREVDDAYLDMLLDRGETLARLHRALLPLDEIDFGAEGFGARIEPYRSCMRRGTSSDFDVQVRNPFARRSTARVRLVLPPGWEADPPWVCLPMGALASTGIRFRVRAGGHPARRVRIAVDLGVDDVEFGQQAEALVDVLLD